MRLNAADLAAMVAMGLVLARDVRGQEVEPTFAASIHGQFSGPWDLKQQMRSQEVTINESYLWIIEIAHAGVLPPSSPEDADSANAGKVIFINDRLPVGSLATWGTQLDQPTFLWDARDPSIIETLWVGNTAAEDLFCGGHTFLPFGFFVTGGLNRHDAYQGDLPVGHGATFVLRTDVDDPELPFWQRQSVDDGDPRWYPTALMLGTRSVMVGGHLGNPQQNLDSYRRLFVPSVPVPATGNVGEWGATTPNTRENLQAYPPIVNCPASDNFRLFLADYPRLVMLSTGQVMYVDGKTKQAPLSPGPGTLPAGLQQSFFLNVDPTVAATCAPGTVDPANPWQWISGEPAIGSADAQHAGGNVVHLLTQIREAEPGSPTLPSVPTDDVFVETIYLIAGTKHGEDDKPCPCDPIDATDAMRRIVRRTDAQQDDLLEGQDDAWVKLAWELSDPENDDAAVIPKTLRRKRVNCNTVVALDGSMVTFGGTRHDDDALSFVPDCPPPVPPTDPNLSQAGNPNASGCVHVMNAERFRPKEVFHAETYDKWQLLPPMAHKRQYHSVAMLLPSGAIAVGGGTYYVPAPQVIEDHRYSVEIYKPWYFFAGPRPQIVSVSQHVVGHGEAMDIDVKLRDLESEVAGVYMLRNASVTHAFDSNQRLIEPFVTSIVGVQGTDDTFRVTFKIPQSTFVATPGWYMVTVVDDSHRPSESQWVLVE